MNVIKGQPICLLLCLWMMSCDQGGANPSFMAGRRVVGRVMTADSLPVGWSTLFVPGTEYSALTAQDGSFAFSYFPVESTVICLSFHDSIIAVGSGTDDVNLGVFVLESPHGIPSPREMSFSVRDGRDSSLIAFHLLQYMISRQQCMVPVSAEVDSFFVEGQPLNMSDNNSPLHYALWAGNQLIDSGFSPKARITSPCMKVSASMTVVLTEGSDTLLAFLVTQPSLIRNSLFVTTAVATVEPFKPYVPGGVWTADILESKVYMDGTAFRLTYSLVQRADFDIALVSETLGDTCSRNAPVRWWGGSLESDSIRFTGDQMVLAQLGQPPHLRTTTGEGFVPDRIESRNVPDGTYTIVVTLYDKGIEADYEPPVLSIQAQTYPYMDESAALTYYQATPSQDLDSGDRWIAGTIEFPSRTYSVIDSVIRRERGK